MVKIYRNPNFPTWFNITLYGKVVDNARTQAQALTLADKLRREHKVPLIRR